MLFPSRRARHLLGAALLALAVSSCGGGAETEEPDAAEPSADTAAFDDMSGDEIVELSRLTMLGADSMRVRGELEDSSGVTTSVDLSVTKAGDCAGSLALDGAEAEMMVADGDQYLKGSADLWISMGGEKEGQVAADLFGGRWVKLGSGQDEFSQLCEFSELFDDSNESGSRPARKGEIEEIDGVPAIKLTHVVDGARQILWVAVDGEPYALQGRLNGDESGTLWFSDFNEPVEIEAPADAIELPGAE